MFCDLKTFKPTNEEGFMGQIILATMVGATACVSPPNVVDGYCNPFGQFVPGMITNDTWMTPQPTYTEGRMVFYGPYAMEATREYRDIDYEKEGCIGGVSLHSPYNIGDKAWIKVEDEWYGPFCVVDCARRGDMYTTVVYREEVVEVDFWFALEMGMVSDHVEGLYDVYEWFLPVEVLINVSPEVYFLINEDPTPVNYKEYFLENLEFATKEPRRVITLVEGELWKEFNNNVYWKKSGNSTRLEMLAIKHGIRLWKEIHSDFSCIPV